MLLLSKSLYAHYMQKLKNCGVDAECLSGYIKWLRYYLDFCDKYLVTEVESERLSLFMDKLRSKGQGASQCEQASHAVSLYLDMKQHLIQRGQAPAEPVPPVQPQAHTEVSAQGMPEQVQARPQRPETTATPSVQPLATRDATDLASICLPGTRRSRIHRSGTRSWKRWRTRSGCGTTPARR